MCSQVEGASTSNTVPGIEGDLLNQVLSAETTAVPKVSVPVPVLKEMEVKMRGLAAALGKGFDENPTYHVTSEEAFMSATQPGEVAVAGPRGALLVTVKEPEASGKSGGAGKGEDVWKIGLSVMGHGGTMAPAPHVTMGVVVGGDSAKIVSYEVSPTATEELGALGLNVWCIVKNGGASILTTIVGALPSLAAGPGAFMAALTASLGAGSVDLITKVMACF